MICGLFSSFRKIRQRCRQPSVHIVLLPLVSGRTLGFSLHTICELGFAPGWSWCSARCAAGHGTECISSGTEADRHGIVMSSNCQRGTVEALLTFCSMKDSFQSFQFSVFHLSLFVFKHLFLGYFSQLPHLGY